MKAKQDQQTEGHPVANVVIAAGGTAGHVVPALAIADELRDKGAVVSFMGARGRLEEELVPLLVAKSYDLVLYRGTIARAHTRYFPAIKRRAGEIVFDHFVSFDVRMCNMTGKLRQIVCNIII